MSFTYTTSPAGAKDKVRGTSSWAKSSRHRAKISASNKATKRSPEGRRRIEQAKLRMRAFWRSPEGRAKRAEANRKTWRDPAARRRRIAGMTKALHRPEVRRRHLLAIRRNAKTVSRLVIQLVNARKKGDKALHEFWRTRIKEGKSTSESRKRHSRASKRRWKNPKIAHRMIQSMQLAPNHLERKVLGVLVSAFPEAGWKFNNGQVIAGKIPDFVRSDGVPLVVDAFGDYWHRKDIPSTIRKRQDVFRRAGYRLVVVWERELRVGSQNLLRQVQRAERKVCRGV